MVPYTERSFCFHLGTEASEQGSGLGESLTVGVVLDEPDSWKRAARQRVDRRSGLHSPGMASDSSALYDIRRASYGL